MGMFDYTRATNDLTRRYSQDQATQNFGRFVAQNAFMRQRKDATQSFGQRFPKLTGGLARRFGSNVRSGQIGANIGQAVNQFNQGMGDIDQQQADWNAKFQMQNQQANANYRAALLKLREDLDAGRAMSNPFATYMNVWGQ